MWNQKAINKIEKKGQSEKRDYKHKKNKIHKNKKLK